MKKFEPYKFRKYQKNYPFLFRREKYKLKKILPSDAKIEHFGSTSVPDLGGKGVLDISISVKEHDINGTISKMQKNGYVFFPYAGSDERRFFRRDYKYGDRIRRVHLHLFSHGSFEFKRVLAVSKYLKENKEVAKKYAEIKKQAAKVAKGDGMKYRECKEEFVEELEKMALKNI